jgi:hypothetical protein
MSAIVLLQRMRNQIFEMWGNEENNQEQPDLEIA